MLLSHSNSYTKDKLIQVAIVYNYFREGLVQRMPRRFHVVNNYYTHWEVKSQPSIVTKIDMLLLPLFSQGGSVS
ncbi:hypothetical protein YC2023_095146 [Brassica napus]